MITHEYVAKKTSETLHVQAIREAPDLSASPSHATVRLCMVLIAGLLSFVHIQGFLKKKNRVALRGPVYPKLPAECALGWRYAELEPETHRQHKYRRQVLFRTAVLGLKVLLWADVVLYFSGAASTLALAALRMHQPGQKDCRCAATRCRPLVKKRNGV